jgi:predicted transcriptional regulator
MQTQANRTTLNIDLPTYRRLAEVARQNERSASAEARLAIRRHLEAASAADKLVAAGAARVGAA